MQAAVYVEDVAGDVGGLVAGQENDGGGYVAGGAQAAERNARLQFFFHLVRQHGGHWRFDEAGSDGIHGDVARGDFDGDGFGQADQAGFCGDIIGLAGIARLGYHRADVDDAARAGFHHRRQSLLDAEMRAGEIGAQDYFQSSGFMRMARPSRVVAALLTRISRRPNFSRTRLKPALTCSASDTSIFTASAVPPAAVISATSAKSFSSLRAATATFAPASASASAVSRPMPWEAPVMRATLSFKLNI